MCHFGDPLFINKIFKTSINCMFYFKSQASDSKEAVVDETEAVVANPS